MNAMHQHLLDSYRASRTGEPAPPLPGRHDREAVRELSAALKRLLRPGRTADRR
ncbi:hypothetical protein ABZ208_29430 [Streptomyces sp. NPDC006208]|uniref:hypothetical protein n=1 Tax=Streptomyces sp. NPDC006208 TaxID=3156734 RepID=UPI0033BEF7D2